MASFPSHQYHSHAAHHHRPYNPMAAVSAPAGTFLPGTKVQVGSHRVVVEKYLSEGGFAHVYVVRLPQPLDGTDRAVLKRVAVPDKAALANMRTEVETMKRLKGHRHIVKYIDSHASQLRGGGFEVFLLMEFCSGGGLIDFMNTRLQNRLTEPEIMTIFTDAAEGVACMHYLKPPLLHRDLKVENILISKQGGTSYYKLCDFGSAAPPRPAATSAAEGRLIEDDVQRHTTMQYRSPEMIDVYRKQPIDEKSDIWALGVLLYKLCYYTTPFEEVGQMAILNASYKFPSYPQFSDRLRMLIAWMLKEDPQKRPNVYEVLREACRMQGREVPIRDIYAGRSKSEARRFQELPPASPEAPQVGAVFSPPVQETQIIPEIAPMRRGRPTKPVASSQHSSAKPSPSPFRGGNSGTDPFAVLDGGGSGHKARNSEHDFTNRFPSLDQFHILHEKGGKFDFEPTVTENKEEEDLSRRLTNALADEAFGRPSTERKPAPDPSAYRRRQPSPVKSRPDHYRDEPSQPQPQAPLYQPVPQKPAMVSTGTMTSPPETPLPDPKPSSRPIFRFPSSDNQDRSSSRPRVTETDKKPLPKVPSPTRSSVRLEPVPRASADTLSQLSAASSRPSLEALRPLNSDLDNDPVGRSKSANSKIRPVSLHAGAKLDIPRASESARSSLDLPRSPYEIGVPLQHAETDQGYSDGGNISSDIDYLRAREEENNKKREKRSSGSAKHTKRSSLTTLSLSGTKTLLAGRFGDAFRRFEQSGPDSSSKPQSPATEEPPPPQLPPKPVQTSSTITTSEVMTSPTEYPNDNESESDDISPEMRRELERRRLSQEEKRVANAAAEYRRQVAEKGDSRLAADTPRSLAIQNRLQAYNDASKPAPAPPKTASGYGRFTDDERSNANMNQGLKQNQNSNSTPALQAKQIETTRTETRVTTTRPVTYYSEPRSTSTPQSLPLPRQETSSAAASDAQRPASAARPPAPPKPKSLRVGTDPSRPISREQATPTSPGDDWESNFSRRFPSLAGLEMVETDIPKMASLRTKEV